MYGNDFERELEAVEAAFPEERKRAALIMAIHAVQRRAGHVGVEAQAWLAERYGITVADVQGVISFYTMLFDEKVGEHVVWVCRTFSCHIMGAEAVMEAFEKALACREGETDASGQFTLKWMECLAACDKAPCALIDDDMYECLTPDSVEIVLEHVRSGGRGGLIQREGGAPKLTPAALSAGDWLRSGGGTSSRGEEN